MANHKQKRFLKLMLDLDISQQELAARLGVHSSLISLIANGWRKPTPELADKIEKLLSAKGLFEEK